MGLKVVKKSAGSGVRKMSEVMADTQKKLGPTIGSYGGKPVEAERIPTGLFPFDLATGGGFPRGRASIVYGPEDSAKTSVIYKAIASHQRLWPDQTCVYVAIEPFDAIWAKKLGVDTAKLAVFTPLFAEEAADMVGDSLEAEDCGLVALDSIAAMITVQEADKSAEGDNPGRSAIAVGKLVRRSALALRKAEMEGRAPSLIYINQTRFKIGVMYGNPETMPGGNAPLFQSQLTVRFHGKAVHDKAVSDKFPVAREINFTMRKTKVPILADSGAATMITYGHEGLAVGDTDDYNTISTYLKDFGALAKNPKKGWDILGDTYPTLDAFKARVYTDREFGAGVRTAIIERCLADKDGGEFIASEIKVNADGEIIEVPTEPEK